jgi:hypothetical protein
MRLRVGVLEQPAVAIPPGYPPPVWRNPRGERLYEMDRAISMRNELMLRMFGLMNHPPSAPISTRSS